MADYSRWSKYRKSLAILKDYHGEYKVIKLKHGKPGRKVIITEEYLFTDWDDDKPWPVGDRQEEFVPEVESLEDEAYKKLSASLSRAKSVIIQYVSCNDFDWFVSLTLDPKRYDRTDLPQFKKDLNDFTKYQRRKHDIEFKYLLIPEPHKDGANERF